MKYYILTVLMLAALTGCVEVDSVLTVEADGAGSLEQTAALSPMAVLMIEGRMARRGETPILSEAGAGQWTKAHPACGVRIETFTVVEQTNAARQVHVELAYDSLQQLAATVWGHALQLAVTNQGDAVVVSLDDPVRNFLLSQTRGQVDMSILARAPEGDRPLHPEDHATLDMLQRALRGLTSRVAVNLPVPAGHVTGAQLTGDGKVVEARGGAGETVASLRAYAASPRLSISVPDAAVEWTAFPRLLSIAHQQIHKPLVRKQAITNVSCHIRSLEINSSRRLNVDKGAVQTNTTERFNARLSVLAPVGIRAMRDDSLSIRQTSSGHEVSAVDETGKELATERTRLHFHPQRGDGNRHSQTNRPCIGSISIDHMAIPTPETRRLARLAGGVNMLQVLEEKELVVKPLTAHLHEDYPLPDGATLTFTDIKERRINYDLAWQPETRTPNIQVTFFGPDGIELKSGGSGSSGGGNRRESHKSFREAIPEGAYAVVRYPTKVVSSWIPFSFIDVELP